jgi:hypothetical protein
MNPLTGTTMWFNETFTDPLEHWRDGQPSEADALVCFDFTRKITDSSVCFTLARHVAHGHGLLGDVTEMLAKSRIVTESLIDLGILRRSRCAIKQALNEKIVVHVGESRCSTHCLSWRCRRESH